MIDLIKGKYRITREIARSNDIVYEALDTSLGRRIALKELNFPPNLVGQARRERIERFNREARAAGRLSHPNIVSVYEFGEESGRHFIAMEYLEGQTLRDMLQAQGALPLKEAVDIACQVLDALGYAHANKVIHRDIKPDNIFILPGGQVKLTDFGIARLTEEPSLTSDGQVFGTPSYMSPEQIEGRAIDYRSDLFSLGVVLYEMLLGRKPFTGDSVVSITYAVMNADPPNMLGVPTGIEQVVRRALSKSPNQRAVSAEQMRQDLRNAEQTPALFFPSGSGWTSMNQTGMGGGTGYGTNGAGYGAALPSVYPGGAAPYGAPPAPQYSGSGAVLPPSAAGSNAQQAGGLPWNWNNPGSAPASTGAGMPATNSNSQPAAYGAGGPLISSGGIFPYSSPPFPARPPEPLIVLSPGTKRVLIAIAAAVLIGVCGGFGVVGFMNKYAQFQSEVHTQQVASLMTRAETAYNGGNYPQAATVFKQALSAGPSPEYRAKILTELAYTYVFLARTALNSGDTATAKSDYEQAIDYSPRFDLAHSELASLLQRIGDRDGAREQQSAIINSPDGASLPQKLDSSTVITSGTRGSDGPVIGGQDPNQFIDTRRQEAQQLIREGDALDVQGDRAGAETKWQQAVEKGAGFPEGDEARSRLDQPHGESTDGSPQ